MVVGLGVAGFGGLLGASSSSSWLRRLQMVFGELLMPHRGREFSIVGCDDIARDGLFSCGVVDGQVGGAEPVSNQNSLVNSLAV